MNMLKNKRKTEEKIITLITNQPLKKFQKTTFLATWAHNQFFCRKFQKYLENWSMDVLGFLISQCICKNCCRVENKKDKNME